MVKYLGVTNAQPLYKHAIAALEDAPASHMCLGFADPRRDPDFWKAWHDFEVVYGNEEMF
eukprot:7545768-Ditylum_brightwellii.AAC.1